MTSAPPPVAGTGLPVESAPAIVPPASVAVEPSTTPVEAGKAFVEPIVVETATAPSADDTNAAESSAAPLGAPVVDVALSVHDAPMASGSRSAAPPHTGDALPQRAPMPRPGATNGIEHPDTDAGERGATGPQLRRFIKSRAYVPMHELRRRFLINGGDDEVTPVDLGERRRVFVGLPEREGRLLGELLRGGDIGYELSLDPISPIVVGVYPMRPVTRG